MMVPDGAGGFREATLPVLALSFEYGGVSIRSSDKRPRFFTASASGPAPVTRDPDAERAARYLLESFGAVEIACLEDHSAIPGSEADYLVRVDEDVHGVCSFSAYAVPQLRALGWQLEVASDYPYQIVTGDGPWYARVAPTDTSNDWFSLELGIEVEGRQVNLLPALLDLLERLPANGRLESLIPQGARCFALPLGDGRYLPVPPDRVRLLVTVLRDLYSPDTSGKVSGTSSRAGQESGTARAGNVSGTSAGKLLFSGTKAASVASLDAAFEGGNLRWQGDRRLPERGRALASAPSPAEAPPTGLRATLRPYQLEGLAWLQHLRLHGASGVLADDMGLGKTLQTIAHLVAEREAGRLRDPALVVAPTSLMGNWRRELQRFAPFLRVTVLYGPRRRQLLPAIGRSDVVVTTYGALVRDEDALSRQPFSLLVLDEAQAVKNPRSQARRAATAIQAPHRIALSGTPVENSLTELWSIFDLLMPGLLGDADWFRHRYVQPIESEGNEERMAALRAQVAPFLLRRTKEEVAWDLPPKTELVRPVELRGAQRDLYESLRVAAHAEVRQAIRRKGLAGSTIAILDALMKLRQVCCDPRLLPGDAAQNVQTSAKHDLFMDLLGQQLARGRRVLVFSQFTSMLALIGESLRRDGIGYVELTGATTNRQRAVDTFEGRKVDVFLISLKAGGTGLNLVSADTVIHYDPWWNPAAQAQATDRAHRIGQTRPVFVYQLIVAGTVEERMLALQRRKQQLADGLLGRPGDPQSRLPLSERDVDQLFAPITDDPPE
jgi:superfamily II DNA or RNA helicase